MRLKEERDIITEKIKALRQIAGLTQEDLAELLGISRATYANYETRSVPRGKLLERLADIYGVDPQVFSVEAGNSLLDMQGRLNDSAYRAARGISTLPEDETTLLLLYRLLEKEQQEQLLHQLSQTLCRSEETQD